MCSLLSSECFLAKSHGGRSDVGGTSSVPGKDGTLPGSSRDVSFTATWSTKCFTTRGEGAHRVGSVPSKEVLISSSRTGRGETSGCGDRSDPVLPLLRSVMFLWVPHRLSPEVITSIAPESVGPLVQRRTLSSKEFRVIFLLLVNE